MDILSNRLGSVLAVELKVLLKQALVEAGDLPGGDAVFEAGEGRLLARPFSLSSLLQRSLRAGSLHRRVVVASVKGHGGVEVRRKKHQGWHAVGEWSEDGVRVSGWAC